MVMILSPPRNIFFRRTIQTLGGFLARFLNTNNHPRLSQKNILNKSRLLHICHRCNRSFWAFIKSSTIFHLRLCYGYTIRVFFLAGSSNSEMIFHSAYPVCLDKLIAACGGTNHPLRQLAVFFEVQTLPSLGNELAQIRLCRLNQGLGAIRESLYTLWVRKDKVKSLILLSETPFWWWAPTPQKVRLRIFLTQSSLNEFSANRPLSAW